MNQNSTTVIDLADIRSKFKRLYRRRSLVIPDDCALDFVECINRGLSIDALIELMGIDRTNAVKALRSSEVFTRDVLCNSLLPENTSWINAGASKAVYLDCEVFESRANAKRELIRNGYKRINANNSAVSLLPGNKKSAYFKQGFICEIKKVKTYYCVEKYRIEGV